jgi:hypothetical protein
MLMVAASAFGSIVEAARMTESAAAAFITTRVNEFLLISSPRCGHDTTAPLRRAQQLPFHLQNSAGFFHTAKALVQDL